MPIDKYGVDTRESKTADPNRTIRCPTCGKEFQAADKDGNTLRCPFCGSTAGHEEPQ